MKKLITMIGAAATALGLFADGVINKVITFEQPDFTVGQTISNNTEDATAVFGWYLPEGASEESGTIAAGDDGQYLAVETDAGKPISRTFAAKETSIDAPTPVDIDTGLFMDAKVKFTCAEEAPALAAGTKLTIWAQEIEGDDTAEPPVLPATNLVVTAGSYDDGTITATNFILDVGTNFDFSAWHRVTIRAIKDVTASSIVSGFVIFIDETQVASLDTDYADKVGSLSLTSEASKFFGAKQLFLSCMAAGTPENALLSYAGFEGAGSVDNLALCDKDGAKDICNFAIGEQIFTITIAGAITDFDWAANDGVSSGKKATIEGNSITVDGSATTITFSNLTVSDPTKYSVKDAEDGTLVVDLTKLEEPVINLDVNTIAFIVNGKPFTTFKDAFDEALTSGKPMILNADFAVDPFTIGGPIAGAQSLILDLAGNVLTLNVPQEEPENGLITIDENGALKIISSVAGGEIIASSDEFTGSIVCNYAGTFIVGDAESTDAGASFVGWVDGGYDSCYVKGNFDADNNTSLSGDDFDGAIFVAEDSEYNKVSDYWVVTPKAAPTSKPFAIIIAGETETTTNYFDTLQLAIDNYEGVGVIALMQDSDLEACVAIAKEVTLDLNGFTLGIAEGFTPAGVLAVKHGGDLTIEDSSAGKTGMIDGSTVATAIKMTENASDIDDTKEANLTVNGGTIIGYNYGIGGNGNPGRGNTYVEINGGVVMAVAENDSCAIFNPQAGDVVISGGRIEGGMAIIIKSGTLTVEGGTIKATGIAATWVKSDNGFNNTGDAIEVDNIGYPGESPVVQIKGGTIESVNGAAVASRCFGSHEQITEFVSGGKFKGAVAPDSALIALGEDKDTGKWVTDEDGFLVPYSFFAVAQIGDVKYETLQEALNVGGNVKLLADITGTTMFTVAGTVVLDLNGKTITNTGARKVGKVIAVAEGGSLTINGGSLVSEHDSAIQNKGTLVVKGGSYTGVEGAVFFLGGSITTINDGTFTASDNAVVIGQGLEENGNCTLTINDGTFNGGIVSSGYIACGIYIPNSGAYTINGGTFNIVKGCGICARAGETVVNGGTWNLTGDLTAEGKVGDKGTSIPCKTFVFDDSNPPYPGYVSETDDLVVPALVDAVVNPIKSKVDFSDALVGDDYAVVGPDADGYYSVAQSKAAGFIIRVAGVDAKDVTEGDEVFTIATTDKPLVYIAGQTATVDGEAGAWTVAKPALTEDICVSIVKDETIAAVGKKWYENPTVVAKIANGYGIDTGCGFASDFDVAQDYFVHANGFTGRHGGVSTLAKLLSEGMSAAYIYRTGVDDDGSVADTGIRGATISTTYGVMLAGTVDKTHAGIRAYSLTNDNIVANVRLFKEDGKTEIFPGAFAIIGNELWANDYVGEGKDLFKFTIPAGGFVDGAEWTAAKTVTVGTKSKYHFRANKIGDTTYLYVFGEETGMYLGSDADGATFTVQDGFDRLRYADVAFTDDHVFFFDSVAGKIKMYALDSATGWVTGEATEFNMNAITGHTVGHGASLFVTDNEETLLFMGCGGVYAIQYTTPVYKVTFNVDGAEYAVSNVLENTVCGAPADPVKEGFKFVNWTNETYATGFDFTTPITADLTLEANFEAAGIAPGEIKPLAPGDTTPEAAQAAAAKIPVVLSQADIDAGLTTDVLYTKAQFVGGAWQAVVEVKPAYAPVIETTAEEPISVSATDFTATIENAQPGLYYGFKAVDALGTSAEFQPVGTFQRATESGELTITAPKGIGNARFFKLTVSVTDLTPKAE